MKSPAFSLRSPTVQFRSALAQLGLRLAEDYDELVHAGVDCELRLHLRRLGSGQLVHCFISFDEGRLARSALELFDLMTLEGRPVVAYGAGLGQVTFEFEWLHAGNEDWRSSARRIEDLLQLVHSSLGPRPRPVRHAVFRRLAPELLDGVLARVVSAA